MGTDPFVRYTKDVGAEDVATLGPVGGVRDVQSRCRPSEVVGALRPYCSRAVSLGRESEASPNSVS